MSTNNKNILTINNDFLFPNENEYKANFPLKTWGFSQNPDKKQIGRNNDEKFNRKTRNQYFHPNIIESKLLRRINRNLGENDNIPGIKIHNIGDLPMFRFG